MAATIFFISFVIFVACAAVMLIALVSAGIKREERRLTLTSQAPDRVTQGARRLTGLYVRQVAPAVAPERESTLV
jgi:hypothetical protein